MLFFEFYATKKFQIFEFRPFLPNQPILHSPVFPKQFSDNMLVVVDPLNEMNNVTRSTFSTDRVEALFAFLFFALHQKTDQLLLKQIFDVAKILNQTNCN